VFLLQSWWQTNKNSARVLEMFAEKFRDTPVPTRNQFTILTTISAPWKRE
jgi:hypothetical protein